MTEDQIISEAKKKYESDNIQVLDSANICPTPDGTWVEAWVWVESVTEDMGN